MEDLSNYRKSYEKSALSESTIDADPLMQFKRWFYEMDQIGGVEEANAMTVSTIGLDGFPKARVVLLKKFNENGFVFYTNYNSEKGKAILANPHICLSFFWASAERQIIIKGIAEKTSDLESENYFHSRPVGSQIGAAISPQSEVIPNADYLAERMKEAENVLIAEQIERPAHWGGFLVKPVSIEFWQGRPNRLHDRIRYTIKEMDWIIERLAP